MNNRDVFVIQIPLDGHAVAHAWLSSDERAHATRFVFERDRRRYVNAHTAMRHVIGWFANAEPQRLAFQRGKNGKPFLRLPQIDLRFNLSHSGEYALVGMAVGRELGIDIEQHRDLDVEALAEDVFSPAERIALAELPGPDRLAAFYRGWARKESFIKALGDGLQCPLASFDVSLADPAWPILRASRRNAKDVSKWSIRGLPSPKGYAAAVAAEGRSWQVRWHCVEAFGDQLPDAVTLSSQLTNAFSRAPDGQENGPHGNA